MARLDRTLLTSALSALFLCGCAFPPADINLAPLFAHETLGDHGWRSEIAGSVVSFGTCDHRSHLALRPLTYWEWDEERTEADFLFPLGHYTEDAEESRLLMIPLGWSTSRLNQNGIRDRDWALLPILFGGTSTDGEDYFALFPIYGHVRDYFTFDEIDFVLFPLWTSNRKGERRGWSVLWPLIGGASGGGHDNFRILPFYSSSHIEDKKDGLSILWPFFNHTRSDQHLKDPRDSWMVFPFYGHETQGSFRATSILWPILGWSSNDEGYSAFQIWPLVRIVRGGDGEGRPYERTVIRPLYTHYRSKQIESRSYLWPIVWIREEHFPDPEHPLIQRSSVDVLPLWQSFEAHRPEGRHAYLQAWPALHHELRPDGREVLQAISPILYRPFVEDWERNFLPFYTLFRSERHAPDLRTTRGPLGIYRAVSTDAEWRFSLPLLGGFRATEAGRRELSLLAGLLRLRLDGGIGFMPPAFPGPGFEPLKSEASER